MLEPSNTQHSGAKSVPQISLTDLSIKRFPTPEKGTETYWDTRQRGLGFRISQGGARTFVVLVDSGRRKAIGRYPTISLADARTEARRILAEKTLGRSDPTTTTFDQALSLFLAYCEQRNRPRTVRDYRRLLSRHFPFGKKRLADISPHDITKRIDPLPPSEGFHALVVVKVFFRWAQRRSLIDASPCERLQATNRPVPRDRVLDDNEVREVLLAAGREGFPFGHMILLLILTGQRRGEVGQLRWQYIDQEKRTITLPAAITKNGRVHMFPYGQAVADVFAAIPRQSDYLFPASRDHVRNKPTTVFSGWSKCKMQFDRKCQIAPWTMHDCRRTFSSGMAALGISQTVVEKLLNHVSGGILSPIAQVYNRHSYMEEMRAAITEWDAKLASLMTA